MRRGAPAWIVAAVGLLLVAIVELLNAGAGPYAADSAENILGITAYAAWATVGWILTTRRPRNPIGWLMLSSALAIVLVALAPAFAGYSLNHGNSLPGTRFAAVFSTHDWPLLFAGLTAVAYTFPDGRLPSPRWRPIAYLAAASFAVVFILGMLGDQRLDSPFESVEPYGVTSPFLSVLRALGLLGMSIALILAFVAIGSRFRGSSGVLRQQLKWITYAAALIPLAIVVGMAQAFVLGGSGAVSALAVLVPLVAIPAAIGVAVLRYRLYEIDRLINVTLVYVALTVALAAGFAAIVVLGGIALGGGSTAPTAAATLAVAVAFRPLRNRVQAIVDRRLNPEAFEGLRRIDRFLSELREGKAEPEAIEGELSAAVSDPSLRLFFWLPRYEAHADRRGALVRELPASPSGRTPVRRGDLPLGTVVHSARLNDQPLLLNAAITRAGLAIEIARLRVEVRRQLAEVEESRARIVAAGYEERRRLERDLHDGAQQRLISIGLDLRHLQREPEAEAYRVREGLDSAVAALAEAVDELRELATGVRPASLDAGLAAALRELASRAPVATDVDATEERFDPEIEAAAYFVASEGLTNAVKHARGSRIKLSAARVNGWLTLSVSDDGRGGASASGGTGLTGLTDRVEALGGRLKVTSDAVRGTSVVAELPCE